MKLYYIFSIVLIGTTDVSCSVKTKQITLAIQDRVAILKSQIADQLKDKRYSRPITLSDRINEDIEYVDHENEPITPINEKDPRKKKEKFRLKEMKTTRDIGQNFKNRDLDRKIPERNNEKRSEKAVQRNSQGKTQSNTLKPIQTKGKIKKSKITDVFYRRLFSDKYADKWTHCQDLISPFLTGYKKNMTSSKRIAYDNPVVIRLIQLLTEDLTDHTKDDIHSILYQISNLQLRLFQWDVAAIKLLLNVLHRDKTKRHSFKTIKMGLRGVFQSWKLDFSSNIDVLIKQSRIFRPPCIQITENEGSTKTSRSVRYTKSVKPNKRCVKADPDYENCRANNY